MIVNLRNQKLLSDRFKDQRAPTGTHDGRSHLGKLFAETPEISEIFLNGGGEISSWRAAAFGSHISPEDRMEDVSGKIESQCAFQCAQPRKIVLPSRFIELFQGGVGAFHVISVMFSMVQLHDLAGNVRLQRVVVIR